MMNSNLLREQKSKLENFRILSYLSKASAFSASLYILDKVESTVSFHWTHGQQNTLVNALRVGT